MKRLAALLCLLFSYSVFAQTATLESFGAVGDGVTSDYTAIKNALNSANTTILGTPGKIYAFDTSIKLPHGKTFDGQGATLKSIAGLPQGQNYIYTHADMNVYDTGSKSLAVVEGQTKFVHPVAANYIVGDLILLKGPVFTTDNDSMSGGGQYKYGWFSEVTAKSGDTLTLKHPCVKGFRVTGFRLYSRTGKGSGYLGDMTFKNWTLDLTDRTSGRAVEIETVKNVTIQNLIINGTPSNRTAMNQGIEVHGVNVLIDHCTVHGGQVGYDESNAAGGPLSGAYAIAPQGQDVTVQYCKTYDWKSGIVGGGWQRDYLTITLAALYDTVVRAAGTGSGINFHGGGGGRIIGNVLTFGQGDRDCITVRFDHVRVENNTINYDGTLGSGVVASPTGSFYAIDIFENATTDILIRNNIVRVIDPGPTTVIRAITTSDMRQLLVTNGNPSILTGTSGIPLPPLSHITIDSNLLMGRIKLGDDACNKCSQPLGDSILIKNNCIEPYSASFDANIEFDSRDNGYSFRVLENTIKNRGASGSSIITNSKTVTFGKIQYNTLYRLNCLNSSALISLGSTANVTSTPNTTPACGGTVSSCLPTLLQLELRETFTTANQNGASYNGGLGWEQAYQLNSTAPVTGSLSWVKDPGYDAAQPIGAGYATALNTGFIRSTISSPSSSTDTLKRLFYTLRTLAVTRTGKDITRFKFASANSLTTSQLMWPAVKIGTQWFAYGSGLTQTTTSGSTEATAWATYSQVYDIAITGSNWYPITFSGTSLTKSGAAQALPAGDMAGAGVYFFRQGSGSSNLRIDNIEIYTSATTLAFPVAPTGVVYSGTAPNFSLGWNNRTGFTAASSYEYTVDGGLTYTVCSANPQVLPAATYYQAYQCGVRLVATGSQTYSTTGWASSDAKTADLVYKETFPYMGSGNLNGSLGWYHLYSATGTASTSNASTNATGSPELAGLNSYNPQLKTKGHFQNTSSSDRKFAFTNSSNILGISRSGQELSKIRYKTANASSTSTGWGSRPAVKIGSNWYVWGTAPYYQTTAFSDFTDYEQVEWTVNPATSSWYLLTAVEDVSLSLSGTAQTLPSGDIDGVGIYFTRPSASTTAVRFDDVEIYTTGGALPKSSSSTRPLNEEVATTALSARVFPNPTNGRFALQLSTAKAGMATVVIFDGKGAIVERKRVNITEGTQTLPLNLLGKASGLYSVQVRTEEGTKSFKVYLQQ